MRRSIVLVSSDCVLLGLSVVQGQWLETTIYLPDSLGGMVWPGCIAYNPTRNAVRLAGGRGGWVVAIDGETDRKIACIPVGHEVRDLCFNSVNSKLYSANYLRGDVTSIDCVTNEAIAVVTTDDVPRAFCYNPADNKVYCANSGDGPVFDSTVTVIDGATDSVIRTLFVGNEPGAFTWNPVENRVYVANRGRSSISVLRDSVTGLEAEPGPGSGRPGFLPSVVGRLLYVRGETPMFLLDITGRRVMSLQPGENDIRHVAPGVYFCRPTAGSASSWRAEVNSTTKVVVQR
jgi:YVTN family beta-propeller protein